MDEKKLSQKEEKELIENNFRLNSSHLVRWAGLVSKIQRLEKDLVEAKEARKLLENEWPFLANVKGILKKEQKRKEAVQGKEEETPTPKKVRTQSPTKTPKSPATPKRDVRKSLERSMLGVREKNLQALSKTTLSPGRVEALKEAKDVAMKPMDI